MVDNLYHTQTKADVEDDHQFPVAPELLQDAQDEHLDCTDLFLQRVFKCVCEEG